jgi:hypothetical protein
MGGGHHHIGVRDRRAVRTARDQTGDVRDIGNHERVDLAGDLSKAGEVDGSGHGGAAAEEELRPLFERERTHSLHVNLSGCAIDAVVDGVEPDSGGRDSPAVG